ncbi:MAG: TetR family transcriptional regulator [Actinoplanes sp.]
MSTEPPRRARQDRAVETEAALKEAARRVFARSGYLNARIADITAEAGRSAGAFYRHFAGKEELLLALLTDWVTEATGQVAATAPQPGVTPREALRPPIAVYWQVYGAHLAEIQALRQASQVNPMFAERLAEFRHGALGPIRNQLTRLRTAGFTLAGEPAVLAVACNVLLEGFCELWHRTGGRPGGHPISDEEAVDTLTTMLLHGLVPDVFDPDSRKLAEPRLRIAASEKEPDILGEYAAALRTGLAAETSRTYLSKVRGFLAWLDDGAALTDPAARDRAVLAYRSHLTDTLGRSATTVNTALAAVDDFYTRRGLGPASVERVPVRRDAPRVLTAAELRRWERAAAVQSARDRAIALTPRHTGMRIAEVVALDLTDVDRLPPALRDVCQSWLAERATWPNASGTAALFLNQRGGRLTTRAATTIFTTIDPTVTADIVRRSHSG